MAIGSRFIMNLLQSVPASSKLPVVPCLESNHPWFKVCLNFHSCCGGCSIASCDSFHCESLNCYKLPNICSVSSCSILFGPVPDADCIVSADRYSCLKKLSCILILCSSATFGNAGKCHCSICASVNDLLHLQLKEQFLIKYNTEVFCFF